MGQDWDEVNPDFSSEWTGNSQWQPYLQPTTYLSKPRRLLSRIKTSMWPRLPPSAEKLRPTAYLDGLRGFAAFLVYWHHHQLWAHMATGQTAILENGFGYNGYYHMATLPGIRHFFSGGHYAVSTFFVISGYVLALKPMSLIHAGEYVKLGDNLASALFRRWLRLFLPLLATMGTYAMLWHLLGNLWVSGAKPQSNWRDELWAFYCEFKNFSFIFKEGGVPWLSYNFHLWSIPLEFRGSIVIYTSALAFSRCTRNARLWCQLGLIFYFMYIADGWYCSLFVAGMFICDLEMLAKKGELPRLLTRLEPMKKFIFYHLLVISLYLGGVPAENGDINQLAKTRGWYFLSFLKPQAVFNYKWFYLFWAATFLVASVPRIPWLKGFFETRFCQYLGRVSFSLYLVHGPVLWTLGDRLYLAVGWQTEEHMKHIAHWANKLPLPTSGPLGLEIALLAPHIILLPLTFFLAEFVTRHVDAPSVDFAAWLYRKALGNGGGSAGSGAAGDAPIKQASA